jgi:hypothetical protein
MALNMNAAVKIKASVDGLSQITGLQKSLGGVESQSNRTGGALGRLRGMAGGAMNALRMIAPAASIAGLVAMGKRTLDAADALSKMSQRTGVAVPELAKFQKAAALSDTSLEKVGKSLGLLSKGMVAAQNGTGPAAEAFQKLGINVTDANGKLRSSGDVMIDIAERFKNMPDGAEKAAMAMQLFGKSGMDLIPMLNMGGEAIKKLGTNMTQEFADKAAAFNDRITTMQGKIGDLSTRLTIALLPAFEAVIGLVEKALDAFINLPGPIQAVVGIVGALGVAFIALAPALAALSGLGAVFSGIGAAIAAANIGGLIAGWLPAIASIGPTLLAVGKVLLAIFTGPVGWVALAVAAGAAIYAFRDQIGQAFQAIGGMLQAGAAGFKSMFIDPVVAGFTAVVQFVNANFVQPISTAISGLVQAIGNIFQNVTQAITAPFQAAFNAVRGIVNQILNGIGSAINSVIGAINSIIQGANRALARLNLPQIPTLPQAQIPQFAKGGVVSGPTIAMVGEGGEPEYIVPQSKASGFAANWMAGRRGAAAIPAFANGGVIMPRGAVPQFAEGGMVTPGTAQVSIQTGPVTQMDGQNFVTTQDLSRAVQSGVQQTLAMLRNDIGTRRAVGIA